MIHDTLYGLSKFLKRLDPQNSDDLLIVRVLSDLYFILF